MSRLAQPTVRQTMPARRAVRPMEIGEGMMCFLMVEMRGGMIEKEIGKLTRGYLKNIKRFQVAS